MPRSTPPPGPLDELEWPTELTAHVVAPTDPPRVHGYDVQGDLARSFSFGAVMLATLTGEIGTREAAAALDVCLAFLSPAPIWEAPANAASLARRAGSPPAGVLATGAVALSEQARYEVERHAELLAALDADASTFPLAYCSAEEHDREAVGRLRDALSARSAEELAFPAGDPTLAAALFAVLHRIGLRRTEQLVAVWLVAKLPCLTAEAFAGKVGRIVDYPLTTPPYRYEPAKSRPTPEGDDADHG